VDGPAVVPRAPDFPELSRQINALAIRGVQLQLDSSNRERIDLTE